MIKGWFMGIGASVIVHGAGAFLLMSTVVPRPVPDQSPKRSALTLETYAVDQMQAAQAAPDVAKVATDAPDGQSVSASEVPQRNARPAAVRSNLLRAASLPTASKPQPPVVQPLANTVTTAQSIVPASLPAVQAQTPIAPPDTVIAPIAEPTETLTSVVAPSAAAPVLAPDATALAPTDGPVTYATASLAFPGVTDTQSVAAMQSFLAPGDGAATDVRDSLTSALTSVPCARMQVQFRPETATLEVTGHVPDPTLAVPVITALQAQMGADISVSSNLAILPAPQCGVLTGIAATGLPQSTDQIVNPLLVGPDTQTRTFTFAENDALVLDLAAPDYDAYLYIDYFDAEGRVIHLQPNNQVPLQRFDAKSRVQVGARTPAEDGLFVTITPPFGQEIAVAFAASAPIFDDMRPIVEPAVPYLETLKTRIEYARAADSDFKGEWVYFMIVTGP